jgi:protein TonB
MISEAPPSIEVGGVPGGVPGGTPGGVVGGVIGGVAGGLPALSAPPAAAPVVIPAKAPAAPPAQKRIQVSGELQEAMLLTMVKPEYPPLAMRSRIHGAVRMTAIIDKQGKIVELKLVDGHPLLIDAAMSVVKQWRYRPTLQGGEPVEVSTLITVNFRLE